MTARLTTGLVIAVVGGTLLAGCGSSGSSSSSTAGPTSPAAGETSSTAATETPSVPKGATVQQFVAACKATIQAEPRTPANVRTRAEKTCDAAAHGSVEAALQAADEVCVEVIEVIPLLQEYRAKLIAGCKARSR